MKSDFNFDAEGKQAAIMVKIGLELCAYLENLESLAPTDVAFVWYFKLKCGACGEVHDNIVSLEQSEKQVRTSMVYEVRICTRTFIKSCLQNLSK